MTMLYNNVLQLANAIVRTYVFKEAVETRAIVRKIVEQLRSESARNEMIFGDASDGRSRVYRVQGLETLYRPATPANFTTDL
jgi:hypothetical protein